MPDFTVLEEDAVFDLEPIQRLSRDVAEASISLSADEARYLVDAYYTIQDYRKAANNQIGALTRSGEPHSVINWLAQQTEQLERQINRALARWSDSQPLGQWAQSITGIGPVLSAGLMAHIDIEKAPTVGHIWRFAGLDPTQTWEKGHKRPWNADLKVLCWKIGESFVKVSGSQNDIYGKVYLQRKADEVRWNDEGKFADQAAHILSTKRIGKETEAYAAYSRGKLPPAHIHARAKRYAVKLFLSHYHHVAFSLRYGTSPPKPYIIEHGGHIHFIAPPNWPLSDG